MTSEEEYQVGDLTTFWNWAGRYVGYRMNDGLFSYSGHQVGYFAEGDEVYGCDGSYLGEVRSGSRLITNPVKKAWTRRASVPRVLKSSPGHPDLSQKQMLPGYEDFPVAPERNH
jgi:hypothetical protein